MRAEVFDPFIDLTSLREVASQVSWLNAVSFPERSAASLMWWRVSARCPVMA
jgi:hypothetical protein